MASGGGSTASSDRWWYYAAAAAFRRGVEVMAGPVSFAGTRASGFGGWWRAGRARSTARRGGAGGGHGGRGERVRIAANERASERDADGTGEDARRERCRGLFEHGRSPGASRGNE